MRFGVSQGKERALKAKMDALGIKEDDLIEKFSIEKLSPSPGAINFRNFVQSCGLHIRSL